MFMCSILHEIDMDMDMDMDTDMNMFTPNGHGRPFLAKTLFKDSEMSDTVSVKS